MRSLARVATALMGALIVLLITANLAAAHPAGNFTVNRYDGLQVSPGTLSVDHVEDHAEIPTARVQREIDTNGKLAGFAGQRCRAVLSELSVSADRRAVSLRLAGASARLTPGEAGLPTMRVECSLVGAFPKAARMLRFADRGSPDQLGWREITAQGAVARADVPRESISARLTRYPEDRLSSPLDVRTAVVEVGAGAPVSSESASPFDGVTPNVLDRATNAFTALVSQRELTIGLGLAGLAAALLLGAVHAVGPGHGKTIMAAYAAGRGEQSLRDVLVLGATVTATHTGGVLLLGLLVAAGTAFAPELLFPWLGLASGVLVCVVGITLCRGALSRRRHQHAHGHDHGHGHAHGHHHHHGHSHAHGHTHSHADGKPRGRAGVVVMGIAGGLVPTPSAIVVLVGAAAFGHAWFGVLLVLAYGVGMAMTLVLAGLLFVRLSDKLQNRLLHNGKRRRLLSVVPIVTAGIVIALGVGLTARGIGSVVALG
jgi:nickel/cobalt transporter (NicO) family protein